MSSIRSLVITMSLAAALVPIGATEVSLDEALAMARDHSYSLKRSELEIASRSAALEEAHAERLPLVTVRASSSYLTNPPEGISVQPGDLGSVTNPGSTFPVPVPETAVVLVPDPEKTYFQIQANSVWPIVTWGRLAAAEDIARFNVEIASVSARGASADLTRDVSNAYHGLALALESERLLTEIAEIYGEVVADRERSFDAGAVNLESVLDARSQLQQIDAQLVLATEARRSAQSGLRFLLGSAAEVIPVDPWRVSVPPLDIGEITSAAQQFNPDLRSLDIQISQATTFAAIQESSEILKPGLALSVTVEASGQRVPLSPNWREDWDLGLTLTLVSDTVIWDWGGGAAATRQAALAAETASVSREELLASLEVLAAQRVEAVRGAGARLAEKRAALTLAEEREKNARVSFENGLVTREQYLGSQVFRLTSQLEVAAAGFAVESALIELEHLVGETLR